MKTREKRPQFPRRIRQPDVEEVGENGDAIFRFALNQFADPDLTLMEFYRQSVRDLLRIVRFYSNDQPVIVNGFAFLNNPHERIPILDDDHQNHWGN